MGNIVIQMGLLRSKKFSILLCISMILMIIIVSGCSKEEVVVSIKNGENKGNEEKVNSLDMLTPAYYKSNTDTSFIAEVNKFISFVQKEQFYHPLQSSSGKIPFFEVRSKFGDGKGPRRTSEHHPAVDLHVGNNETNVNLYAAYDGYVTTVKDAAKYRNYISITKDIVDNNGELIGKLVTLYAHIDLDLDEAGSLHMDGKNVNKGDIISRHLYSETRGGPHIHFEIRYYRAGDKGTETFYGFANPNNPELSEKSAGNWLYGNWNPNVGYGFGNPKSHGLDF